MTDHIELKTIKDIGKRLARRQRIAHHDALDHVAALFGLQHWKGLTAVWKQGWRPTAAQVTAAELALLAESPAGDDTTLMVDHENDDFDHREEGTIGEHPFHMIVDRFAGVNLHGRGWAITASEAPSEAPRIELDRRYKNNPLSDPAFLAAVLKELDRGTDKLRALIAADWPRRSTKPDADGNVVHPLWADKQPSKEWFCLHCDGTFSGQQIADNMWHCPNCSATPIDIFASPFWRSAA